MLGQHEIKGFAVLINRTVALHPCAFDLDIGLVHAPGAAGCRLSTLGLSETLTIKGPNTHVRVGGEGYEGEDGFRICRPRFLAQNYSDVGSNSWVAFRCCHGAIAPSVNAGHYSRD